MHRRSAAVASQPNAVVASIIVYHQTSLQNMSKVDDLEQPAAAWEARWRGVTFKVPDKSAGQKTILDDCSGAVRGGQVCGILGPSGSGKTTLLDALAGRIDGARKGAGHCWATSRAASAARTSSRRKRSLACLLRLHPASTTFTCTPST